MDNGYGEQFYPTPFLRWIFHFLYTIFYNHNEYSIATVCNIHIFSSWVLFFGTIWIHPCFMKLSVNRSRFLDRDSKITSFTFYFKRTRENFFSDSKITRKMLEKTVFYPKMTQKYFLLLESWARDYTRAKLKDPRLGWSKKKSPTYPYFLLLYFLLKKRSHNIHNSVIYYRFRIDAHFKKLNVFKILECRWRLKTHFIICV